MGRPRPVWLPHALAASVPVRHQASPHDDPNPHRHAAADGALVVLLVAFRMPLPHADANMTLITSAFQDLSR